MLGRSLSTRRGKAPTVVVGQDRGEARASATRARAVHDLWLTRERKRAWSSGGQQVLYVRREGSEPLGTWTCRERPVEGARLTSYKEPEANSEEMMCRLWLVPVTVDQNVETDRGVSRERKRTRRFSSEIRKQCWVGRLDDLCAPNCHDGVPLADATDAD